MKNTSSIRIIGLITLLSTNLNLSYPNNYSDNIKDSLVMESLSSDYNSTNKPQLSPNNTFNNIKIKGYVGTRINQCIEERVKKENIKELTDAFKLKNEKSRWQTEFWGKWVLGAIESWKYKNDPVLYNMIKTSAYDIISTQEKDGYIGNYAPEFQLNQWDVWGQKYTMLGLLNYYLISKDKKALEASKKMFSHLNKQLSDKKLRIIDTGNYHGMASSSILEPILLLYKITNNKKYLVFCEEIVNQWENSDGPHLISYSNKNVADRFPHPQHWFSPENGQKAYEMMSCYEGLLELYKITNNKSFLDAINNTFNNIVNNEINIAGSGSAFECWYHGKEMETIPTYHTMETCVTFTWMQFCKRIYKLTNDPKIIDQIEKSMYNALMASFKGDGSQISKYSPLIGYHTPGEEQCGLHINCCNANGPRAFAMIPELTYTLNNDTININLFLDSEAKFVINKNKVGITQKTDYPKTAPITINISLEKAQKYDLAIRIPSWSEKNIIKINGEEILNNINPGEYLHINRTWNNDDKIEFIPDLRGKVTHKKHCMAINRGPIVLARDTRFKDGYIDQTSTIVEKDGFVDLKLSDDSNFSWMNFTVPLILGTDLENGNNPTYIHFCDFASAGNSWDKNERYRVWIPETLNIMKTKYSGY
ncbi:MAG: glycoside hydrolase family 127 protein [Bacteroidales bacterium]|nr:glycoside hydrolase family 127 protein [Bacteroidales bacterium]